MTRTSAGGSLGPLSVVAFGFLAIAFPMKLQIQGFEPITERGLIASIDEPKFVPAAEAEIADDSWVMGIVIGGEARAYSLNLLNSHEIVNDEVAGQPIAAVW